MEYLEDPTQGMENGGNSMKVWIVKLWEHDDGSEILGVYDSKKKAQAKFEEYLNNKRKE